MYGLLVTIQIKGGFTMALSSSELEALADHLLESQTKNKLKNKSKLEEYPILSPSQYKRRIAMEIPYSNLTTRQKLNAKMKNYDYEEEEVY
jgi:hypothetical protein